MVVNFCATTLKQKGLYTIKTLWTQNFWHICTCILLNSAPEIHLVMTAPSAPIFTFWMRRQLCLQQEISCWSWTCRRKSRRLFVAQVGEALEQLLYVSASSQHSCSINFVFRCWVSFNAECLFLACPIFLLIACIICWFSGRLPF